MPTATSRSRSVHIVSRTRFRGERESHLQADETELPDTGDP
jgi:hypothetical protein